MEFHSFLFFLFGLIYVPVEANGLSLSLSFCLSTAHCFFLRILNMIFVRTLLFCVLFYFISLCAARFFFVASLLLAVAYIVALSPRCRHITAIISRARHINLCNKRIIFAALSQLSMSIILRLFKFYEERNKKLDPFKKHRTIFGLISLALHVLLFIQCLWLFLDIFYCTSLFRINFIVIQYSKCITHSNAVYFISRRVMNICHYVEWTKAVRIYVEQSIL